MENRNPDLIIRCQNPTCKIEFEIPDKDELATRCPKCQIEWRMANPMSQSKYRWLMSSCGVYIRSDGTVYHMPM